MAKARNKLKHAIKDQLIYIKSSCDLFGAGCKAEAIRIAAALNVLLEDRSSSKGILRRIEEYTFLLLSTVPKVEKIDSNMLLWQRRENS